MMDPNDLQKMPVKVHPYLHQQKAYEFTLGLFSLLPSKVRSGGAALLMKMGQKETVFSLVSGDGFSFNANGKEYSIDKDNAEVHI